MNPNGDGPAVPAWMLALGIKEKEWLNMTKAQIKALQRPDKPLKIRVWASGMLHSPGYKGEEATRIRNEARVPYTTADLRDELYKVALDYYKTAGIKLPTEPKELETLKEPKEQLRQALKELEDEGIALRTNLKKVPLRDLSPAELKRLSAGRIRMFFWAKPRPANPETVKREWERRNSEAALKPEVVNLAPPMPPIRLILKALKIDPPKNGSLSNPLYQRAWDAAREAFLQVMLAAPPEVEPTAPPEVVSTAGALEIKEESILEKETTPAGRQAGTPSIPEPAAQQKQPPARPPAEDGLDKLLRPYLRQRPIGTPLDEPMYQRIRGPLTIELFPQFKTEADKVKAPRKWPVYEDIANQVAERGPIEEVAAAAAGSSQSKAEAYARRRQAEREAKQAKAS